MMERAKKKSLKFIIKAKIEKLNKLVGCRDTGIEKTSGFSEEECTP